MYYYLVPIIAGIVAYFLKSLDEKGAIIATTMGILMVYRGIAGFVLLLVFFIVGDIATKYRYSFKKKMGVAGMTSIRKSSNVLANGIIAVIFSLSGYPAAVIGSVSTALADTLSSELGTASGKKPRLITNFKVVKIGENGGITTPGSIASLLGTLIIGISAFLLGMFSLEICLLTAFVGGVVGCFVDSLLGATLQRKKMINNSHVNLIATAVGGMIAIPLTLL